MPTEKARILLISDLHLCDERRELTAAFTHFLQEQAVAADALYILGDLFNFWIGDDHSSQTSEEAASALANLATSGCPVFIMHGNRDFLLGQHYAKRCGAELLPDPYRLHIYDRQYLLMHGDTLCTLDNDYLAFRKMVRDVRWQDEFLAHPLQERLAFADQARRQSKSMSSNKPQDIMDVSQEEVERQLQDNSIHRLVHGHTHRPAVHEFNLDGQNAKRIVLGDWDKDLWYLEINADGETLHRQPIPSSA